MPSIRCYTRSEAPGNDLIRLPGMRLRRLLVATALLALSPASAWASGGVWSPVAVAPTVAKGSADLPRLAVESDGTAIATKDYYGVNLKDLQYEQAAAMVGGYAKRVETPAELEAALTEARAALAAGKSAILNVIMLGKVR